ncbi:MAG: excinuclease ABC subunit UvrC [Actinobacteria bacterium]|nr:excinuclease ABC subunit UvrC [Actinomycetota bacterium]
MPSDKLAAKLDTLPEEPGVYIFKDSGGKVVYVGKAKSLKDRVRSYFRSESSVDRKGRALRAEIADLDINVCGSEVEALILEATLIKKYIPKYNVILRDDKSYPYIEITLTEEFPRARLVRGKRKKGNKYYGPYVNARSARNTIRLLEKVFPLRQCKGSKPGDKGRTPCLYYDMKSCMGPCLGKTGVEEYGKVVGSFCDFLEGRHIDLIKGLEERMAEAAGELNFEEAARLRNQVEAAKGVLNHYMPRAASQGDYDLVGMETDGSAAAFSVARNRSGLHVGTFCFFTRLETRIDDEQLITEFIKRYYDEAFIPRIIYVPVQLHSEGALSRWLASRKGASVQLKLPMRGPKKKELELAAANAALAFEGMKTARSRDKDRVEAALTELKEAFGLKKFPIRIECYDISTMGGTASVGSMVVFQDGFPAKKEYRKFRIKYVAGVDDVGMMKEVLYRRFKRYSMENKQNTRKDDGESNKFSKLPDLVLLDGGKGQLGAGIEVLKVLGIREVELAAIAKKHEEVFRPGNDKSIRLPNNSEGLFLLQRIRDEAHDSAVSYNRLIMNKATTGSWLDDITGVGPGRKKALIKHFGSPGKVRSATLEELREVPGLPGNVAETVYDYMRSADKAVK